jgi:sugar phosphate isomerase/epimerase
LPGYGVDGEAIDMKICIVTDEISADPETAIELGVEWGVRDFELRGFGTHRVPLLTDYQKQRIKELLEEFGARIVAISPGLFKIPYPPAERGRFPLRTFDVALYQQWRGAHDQVKYHLEELLPASLEYAKEVGAGQIIAFGFHRGGQAAGIAPDEVLQALRHGAEQAHEVGLQIAVEVEDAFWADTGERTAEMMKAVDHPALGVNWDPGNAFVAGDTPYPDGYQAVREYVRHVHFKDVARDGDRDYHYVTDGEIDWAGQIRALVTDGYDGYISVETHMQPKVSSARAMCRRLEGLVAAASPGRLDSPQQAK